MFCCITLSCIFSSLCRNYEPETSPLPGFFLHFQNWFLVPRVSKLQIETLGDRLVGDHKITTLHRSSGSLQGICVSFINLQWPTVGQIMLIRLFCKWQMEFPDIPFVLFHTYERDWSSSVFNTYS